MPPSFTITTPSETVRVGPDGRGEMTFTVTNVSGAPTRGLAKITPQGDTNANWFALDEPEREFAQGGVQPFRVAANIPPGTPPGRYLWRFDLVSAMKSGEGSAIGPTVAFEVAPAEPKKKKTRWWIWMAIAAAAIVLAVIAWLIFREPPPKVAVPNVEGDPLATAILELQNAELGMIMEAQLVDPNPLALIVGIGTVVEQSPDAGTEVEKGTPVTIVVRLMRGSRPQIDPATAGRLSATTAKELNRLRRTAQQR